MTNEKCEMRYGKSSECRSDYGEANEKQDRQECLSYGELNVQIGETFFRWQSDEDGAGDP
jgi:hypothetical protein